MQAYIMNQARQVSSTSSSRLEGEGVAAGQRGAEVWEREA
jgi:hypothetical protein